MSNTLVKVGLIKGRLARGGTIMRAKRKVIMYRKPTQQGLANLGHALAFLGLKIESNQLVRSDASGPFALYETLRAAYLRELQG